MKTIFSLIAAVAIGIISSFAQISDNDPQVSINNYKHPNKAKAAASTDSREGLTRTEVTLRNQKTNKVESKSQTSVPASTNVSTNVQGQKTKANYKNQFN